MSGETPDWYFHTGQRRNILHAFKLINDVEGTFMGAFDAYEISHLKSKFNNLSSGQTMLVKVTQEQEKVHSEISKRCSCTICEMMKTSSLLCTSPAAKFKNFLNIYKHLSFPILLQKKKKKKKKNYLTIWQTIQKSKFSDGLFN